MRLVTGAALAAALLLTGCGTQVDPFQDDAADAQAEALEVAWEACAEWSAAPYGRDDAGTDQFFQDRFESAKVAGGIASEAAYLDPRWRTLADAFPYIMGEMASSSSAVRRDGSSYTPSEWVARTEYQAVVNLHGDPENYYQDGTWGFQDTE